MLIVRYNGKMYTSCKMCDDPYLLHKGQLYEVYIVKCIGSLKLYELSGIEGIFPSDWFSRVGESYDTSDTQIWSRRHYSDGEWIRKY